MAGLRDGDRLIGVVRPPSMLATKFSFCLWWLGGGVLTWGHRDAEVGCLRESLQQVLHVRSSWETFTATLLDGRIITWGGFPGFGGADFQEKLRSAIQVQEADVAVAAILADGSVIAAGDEEKGGDCSEVQDQLQEVQELWATGGAFAALLRDERIVTWGDPGCGATSEVLRNVKQVKATGGAFAFLLAGGAVIAQGDPEYGGDCAAVQDRLQNVQQLAATDKSFAAVLSDNSIVTWGSLPDDTNEVPAMLSQQVKSMCSTGGAFAALQMDGSIIAWGSPKCGGDSSNVQEQLRNVEEVCGTDRAFATLLTDGRVVTWGDPEWGGDSRHVQEQLVHVQQLKATLGAFAALTADGALVAWGKPHYGGDCTAIEDEVKKL
ncbi:HERC1 [Symbiodinium natans]|nr:HERC1 [Symbiodinium natans]